MAEPTHPGVGLPGCVFRIHHLFILCLRQLSHLQNVEGDSAYTWEFNLVLPWVDFGKISVHKLAGKPKYSE